MPVHDWSLIFAGGFHDFHQAWTAEIRSALNRGILPKGYYAAIEQVTGGPEPDVVTLESANPDWEKIDSTDTGGAVQIVTETPPQVQFSAEIEPLVYANKANRVAIKHASNDRTVAVIEIVSPGNKHSDKAFESFLAKLENLFWHGIHLLVVDLFNPTPRDPDGFPVAFWGDQGEGKIPQATDDSPLTMCACCSNARPRVYVELFGVGDALQPMPLFLTTERYINVPLEETYTAAWLGVPSEWKAIVDPG